MAGDPFRLLIAVTFLIRTPGRTAIPAFRALMARYPTPEELAALSDADAKRDIVPAIRHLGLGSVRAAAILRYARAWVARPPRPDIRYSVRNYPGPEGHVDSRDDNEDDLRAAAFLGEEGDDEDWKRKEEELLFGTFHETSTARTTLSSSSSAWEIGHMTQGRYALDSWRIFCRDALLGRADDWRGSGSGRRSRAREPKRKRKWRRRHGRGKEINDGCDNTDDDSNDPTFQPEWMRVLPEDKELRAYLRWLWMQEGWDWDPKTGEREVLSPDLYRAVQAGRVGWDVLGQLQILDGDDNADGDGADGGKGSEVE